MGAFVHAAINMLRGIRNGLPSGWDIALKSFGSNKRAGGKEPSFSDTVIYESSLIRIGAFRCDRDYPGFADTGPANNDCFVFPRTAVQIEHEHEPPFAANPNVATFYNRSQHYLRRGISERGDRCDWFGVDRDLARDIVRTADPSIEEKAFRWSRRRCDPRTYLLQRRLFDGITRGSITDEVEIDETVVFLLERLICGTSIADGSGKRRALVHEVECLLSSRFDQPLSLAQIASHTDISVYYLCRTFRAATGLGLHQYLKQLRLRHGLEVVCESASSLTRLALDLGFTHHSHFTEAFRRNFGVTPSKLRALQPRC